MYSMISRGQLNAHRLGRSRRISENQIQECLQRGYVQVIDATQPNTADDKKERQPAEYLISGGFSCSILFVTFSWPMRARPASAPQNILPFCNH